MSIRQKIMLIAAGAALAAPLGAFAQAYGPPGYQAPPDGDQRGFGEPGYGPPGYGQPDYDQHDYDHPRGDWDGRRPMRPSLYPQFRPVEGHIIHEIQEGVRDDMLMPDDAHEFMEQLHRIQYDEMREYRVHGWNLPYDDQARIRSEFERLDHAVDQTRDEP
jgi:hypothetical protein